MEPKQRNNDIRILLYWMSAYGLNCCQPSTPDLDIFVDMERESEDPCS